MDRVRDIDLPWRCQSCGVKLGGAAYFPRGEKDPTICLGCEREAEMATKQ